MNNKKNRANCQQNGDSSATWNPFSTPPACSCSTGYYNTGCTCKRIPDPSNCWAARIKNNSKSWYTEYYWDRADIESENVQYQLRYWNQNGDMTLIRSYATIKRVLEYDWDNRGIDMTAGKIRTAMNCDEDGGSCQFGTPWANCTPITPTPTWEPTKAPTFSPTDGPTSSPTGAPTRQLPWVFIDGICDVSRCDCAGSGRVTNALCCLEEDDDCNEFSRTYSSNQVSRDRDIAQFITVQSFNPQGESYAPPFDTNVYYMFEYIGLSNNTNNTMNGTSPIIRRRLLDDDDDPDTWPMKITPLTGEATYAGTGDSSTATIQFYLRPTPAPKVPGGGDAIFRLTLVNCTSDYEENPEEICRVVYPNEYYLLVPQVEPGAGLSWYERELEPYIWWIVGALAAFLLIIAMLVYWCWNKTRLKGKAIMKKGGELEQLIEEEENGMAPDLNKDQIGYNPLALGGSNSNLISGNADMNPNDEIPKNERANVIVEKFDERVEYGPKYGSTVDDNNGGYNAPQLS